MNNVKEWLQKYDELDFAGFFRLCTVGDVDRVLAKDRLLPEDYLTLLSPAAVERLEEMACRAQAETIKYFGRTVQLFAPIYVSDYCINACVYCGFNRSNHFTRRQLTLEEVEREAAAISAGGIRHILLLTGEDPARSTVAYMVDCVKILKHYFSSISIEVYALTEEQYKLLVDAGVDGMTMFQEVYEEAKYKPLHPAGPKRDFLFRLNAPERACRAGIRTITVGALLGLVPWRQEGFFTGLHAAYLQSRYPAVDVQLAIPRLRPCTGGYQTRTPAGDVDLVQYVLAYRLFMPHSGICISTRERSELRDQMIKLGVTRMSAGVSTAVGGYSEQSRDGQFELADERSVAEISSMLKKNGYQPIFQNWHYSL
ncbi:radical sam [Lucifera butyrica]|uniref:Radical sam n=1 Tax=Lucifera butyrica TaxID=1351585 RepID=A0A498R092_9FIRM|nr:2-iminoacetate synthase ThiH [Lucifera butyrica]VBB05926.1 radical sam [Lucifera butyrica]